MTVEVRLRGPLLEGRAPGIIQNAIKLAVTDLTAEGERNVKLQLYPGHGYLIGHYQGSIHGEPIAGTLHGRIHDSEVVYGPWLEGVSSRNEQTRFKGYAMFRNATQQLERMKGGILEHRVRQAMGMIR
jgi:hypothetical protein